MNNPNDLQITINVAAGTEQAYNAISRVSDWWTRNTEGATSQAGDRFTVRFKETFVRFEVADAQPGRRYVWHVEDCYLHWIENKTEWKDTDVIFNIAPTREGSEIQMIHKGLSPKEECYSDCKTGWQHFLAASLFKLITEGAGTPDGQEVLV